MAARHDAARPLAFTLALAAAFTLAAAPAAAEPPRLLSPPDAAPVHCNYVGPGGGMHPTRVDGATAVLCSDGSRATLGERPGQDAADARVDSLPPAVSSYFELGDVLSTFIGIEYGGLREANPIMRPFTGDWWGYPLMFGVKAGMTAYARRAPPAQCQRTLQLSNALKGGAICNNLGLAFAALALDTSVPLAGSLALMVACGIPAYRLTEASSRAECADGVPSFLLTARAQRRLERLLDNGR